MNRNVADGKTRLPSWFKLSKYDSIGKLTLVDWYKHLSVRQYCMVAIGPDRDWWLETFPEAFHLPDEALKELRLNPLSTDEALERAMASELSGFLPQNILDNLGVRSLTMSELGNQLSTLTEEKRSAICSYGNLTTAQQIAFNLRNRDWLSQTINIHQPQAEMDHLLAIDLNLSQDVLVNQFREWLSEMQDGRRERGSAGRHYAPNIKAWIDMRLLPCIDLMLWAFEEGIQLPKREIARAIQHDGLARESAIAKTTIPLATDFLNHGPRSAKLLRRLRVEAAADLAAIRKAGMSRRRRSENRN